MSDAPAASTEQAATPKKSRKKFLFIIVALVVLLGAGGGGFFFFQRASAKVKTEKVKKPGRKAADEAEGERAKKDDKAAATDLPDDGEVKQVMELQPFIVNLADKEGARYLRLTVSLGIGGEGKETEKPDPLFTTRVRNAMLAVLTTKTSQEVLTTEGKAALRKELLHAASSAVSEPEVYAIYITDFIVQL